MSQATPDAPKEGTMKFQEWHGYIIKAMAQQFAACDDARQIENVLWKLHQAWVDEIEYRVSLANKTTEFARLINGLPTAQQQ